MTTEPASRFIPLDGVFNFRDFGGYLTNDGGRVRSGRLFRSAHLARASAADQERLIELGVAVSVDLRRPGERRAEPCAWPAAATPRIIASDLGVEEDLPPHIRFLRDADSLTAETTRGYMLSTYERLPYEDRHVEAFRGAFSALAAGEGPLHVHCAAGKDRTGVLCALIHAALGVSQADIFHDYDLTNRQDALEGILEQATVRFEQRVGRAITADQLRPMVAVHDEYLETAFDAIDRRSGGVDGYLTEILGVSDEDRRAIQSALVAPASQTVA